MSHHTSPHGQRHTMQALRRTALTLVVAVMVVPVVVAVVVPVVAAEVAAEVPRRECAVSHILSTGFPVSYSPRSPTVTHPPAVCAHCEDEDKAVTPETGLTMDYVAQPPVLIKIHLHHECAPAWCSQFGVPEPGKTFDLPALRDRIAKMSDAEFTRFETHARYCPPLMPSALAPTTSKNFTKPTTNGAAAICNKSPRASPTR